MAQRIGKCTNYSGCKLAYRNEKITVVTKEFRCPECGSPLESLGPKRGLSPTLVLSIGVAIVLLLAVGAILWTLSSSPKRRTEVVELSPTPSPIPTPSPTPTLSAIADAHAIADIDSHAWTERHAHSDWGGFGNHRSRYYVARDRRSQTPGPKAHRPDAERLYPE